MVSKQFKDLNVNDQFTLNNVKYKKIDEVRVSCCRVINACVVDDENNKIQVKPLDEVLVDE